ncbi:MAG: 50S ribosomal protein L21 [Planctomycetaceae bacterium]|nr:50S ribosomal protein L21 [Planctomycetaceae bacterium]
MFAIIADGGRQYRVSQGDRLSVDYRSDVNAGDSITFDQVLLANGGASSVIGQPAIDGATVTGKVLYAEDKGPKLEVQKLRRRKNSRRHTGHRQKYTTVEIGEIQVPGLEIVEPKEEEKKPEPGPQAEETKTEETASAEATNEEKTGEES